MLHFKKSCQIRQCRREILFVITKIRKTIFRKIKPHSSGLLALKPCLSTFRISIFKLVRQSSKLSVNARSAMKKLVKHCKKQRLWLGNFNLPPVAAWAYLGQPDCRRG